MMELGKIHEFVNESSMILIINNNSKSLMDYLFNSIYKKCTLQKYKFEKCKGIIGKIEKLKDKIIKIDIELNKVQFSSSNNYRKRITEFLTLKSIIHENKSKILFKTDLSSYKEFVDLKYIYRSIPSYDAFDLVILIDKECIRIINHRTSGYIHFMDGDVTFNMDQLLRKTKLKQLQNRLKKYESL